MIRIRKWLEIGTRRCRARRILDLSESELSLLRPHVPSQQITAHSAPSSKPRWSWKFGAAQSPAETFREHSHVAIGREPS
jgi:nitroreductase